MEKEIAVRMFENKKLGTTYGKGLYRTAIFNASVELRDPHIKYLLDFYSFERWVHSARTDQQMAVIELAESECKPTDLVSWIVRYDPLSKTKTPVIGVAILDLADETLKVLIDDEEVNVQEGWLLHTRACVGGSNKSPSLIATNTELAQW